MSTFSEFTLLAKSLVEGLAPKLDPEDDWLPAVFTLRDEDLTVHGIDPGFMHDDATKDELADVVIPRIVKSTGAEFAAMVTTAWMVSFDAKTPYGRAGMNAEGHPHTRPSLHPGRIEVVTLLCASEREITSFVSEITRRENDHPLLGDWSPPYEAADRFPSGLRKAFGLPPDDANARIKEVFKP